MMMLALLCYPVLLLTIQGGMNGVYFFLLAVSLWCLYSSPKGAIADYWDSSDTKFAVAMAFPMVAILLSQAAHGEFTARAYDGPSRFLCAVPVFMALRTTNIRVLTVVQYSFPLGAIFALLLVLFGHGFQRSYDYYSGTHRVTSYFLDLIHFGDFALLLGLLSLISINWSRIDPPYVLLLKISGFIAGLYVSFQSGSRGGWVAIPIILLAWFVLSSRKRFSPWAFVLLLIVFMFLLLASYSWIHMVNLRVSEFYDHLIMATQGELDTTVGIRLQHWKAALYIFMEHPMFGVGPDGFPQAIAKLQQSGLVTQKAVLEGSGEVHSDILGSTARLGIFGLLSSLALYFVPLAIFIKLAGSSSNIRRTSAIMGVCFVLGFFIFGLTVEAFSLKMNSSFYGFTLAVLLAGASFAHPGDEQIEARNKA
jgi:O-antigen ligase